LKLILVVDHKKLKSSITVFRKTINQTITTIHNHE